MTISDVHSPTVFGTATDRGPRREVNADRAAVHRFRQRVVAVAVVDGTGSSDEVAEFAELAAEVSVRVAARRRIPMLGVLAANELNADWDADFPDPDGAMAVAVAWPGEPWMVSWVGDCSAFAYDGTTCSRVTSPHTTGQRLRELGMDEDTARLRDRELRHSIGRASVNSVPTVLGGSGLLVVASDGLRLPEDRIGSILAEHQDDLAAAAEALVAAAREAGTTDDVTVVVAAHPDDPR